MSDLRELLGKEILFFDGAMGTELQKRGLQPGEIPDLWNLTHPEVVEQIQSEYVAAGVNLLKTCTFGANGLKLANSGHSVTEVVQASVGIAKKAAQKGGQVFVCLDIGPLGKLLYPYGDLPVEEAIALFAEEVKAGVAAGADAILIETMGDTMEMKAALLAAKENSDLPVLVTMTFDTDGHMLNGADPATAARIAERLGAAAVGFNCGVGPEQLHTLLPKMAAAVQIPLIVNPNAGLPMEENGKTVFSVGPEQFGELCGGLLDKGASVLGGCCGTTPAHIAALVKQCKDKQLVAVERSVGSRYCTSYGRTLEIGLDPKIIGERINPTGKKTLQGALKNRDLDYVCRLALDQLNAGAHILDVNVGTPGVDETELLPLAVQAIQSITDVPLQIDSANPVAIEKALRVYNGVPLLNSVNGGAKSMESILPLVQKYGATVVGLTLDDKGIPETSDGRLAIADRIIQRAAEYGIGKDRIVIDPLALTIGAGQDNANIALTTICRLTTQGLATLLGVSNISFGLPDRDGVNRAFFTMALQAGLSLGIINPQSQGMMDAYYAFRGLSGLDNNLQNLLARFSTKQTQPVQNLQQLTLYDAIVQGMVESARSAAQNELAQVAPMDLINSSLIPALNKVGEGFEKKTVYLPQLLMSADAAKAAFEEIKKKVDVAAEQGPTVVLATVEGDVHDIGKNIVKAIMENYGYRVIDLGKNVPVATVMQAVEQYQPLAVGLSALMTTTVPAMGKTIAALREQKIKVKILVGGAVLTEEYAAKIGADGYAPNAVAAVNFVNNQKNGQK